MPFTVKSSNLQVEAKIAVEIDTSKSESVEDLSQHCQIHPDSCFHLVSPVKISIGEIVVLGDFHIVKTPNTAFCLDLHLYNVTKFSASFELKLDIYEGEIKIANNISCTIPNRKSTYYENFEAINLTSTNENFNEELPFASTWFHPNWNGTINDSTSISIRGEIDLKIGEIKQPACDTSGKLPNAVANVCSDALAQLETQEDFKIICQGEHFRFNKTLLIIFSEVFGRMINNPANKEATDNCVEITDVSTDTIRAFKRVAFGNDPIKDGDLNLELLMFANKYMMKPLAERIKKQLLKTLNDDNVLDLVKVAHDIDDTKLLKSASKYIQDKFSSFKDSDQWIEFTEINPKLTIKIFTCMFSEK